jgi:ferric-dicitrate binding protein FerR (iron transport regulator)
VSTPADRPDGDDETPLEESLGRGLNRQPLDAQALARIRATVRAEFERQHYRPQARTFKARRIALAAALVLATVVGAFALRSGPQGVSVGSILRVDNGELQASSGWLLHHTLEVGATLHAGERCEVSGTALIALGQGGTLRVGSGSTFESTGPNELVLHTGRVYLDFPPGAQSFWVRTGAGAVEHVGTQFEVALYDEGTRVRVREGSVRVHTASRVQPADAGTEVIVQQIGTVVRQTVPTYGPDWAWVEAIAPDFDIEDRPLADFLIWVARETGRHIDFADEHSREVASRTRLHGSVHGLAPLEALNHVMSTTTLKFEIHEDAIRVSSRR